jgi:hypothetical protein
MNNAVIYWLLDLNIIGHAHRGLGDIEFLTDEYYYWSTLIGWSLKIKLQLCKRRKFKHWWSPISSIYTKRTITWTHWTQKRPRHVTFGNPGPSLGQTHIYCRVKFINGNPTLSSWWILTVWWHIYSGLPRRPLISLFMTNWY